ncbi:MAG: gamma-glutamylcyclotransferase [Candidatus Devosia phytovorans]|uniref:glutathione-specific gamma-glutamylcyclotransferase n=1 Tax=Candidatus Devosia phytovorans TaxID=3121372 RepID=A0AAJ5VTF2_9HYPH|nr:gamma-glutamylcyclotransferase [Devosia sp.]WEK04481.1 MAG: gamma-glutamylcyclotransferase [Devosia sp.]
MTTPRIARLTHDHVARVHRDIADPGPVLIEGYRPADDADYAAEVDRILDTAPTSEQFWVFASGSLIWNPPYQVVEQRTGTAAGWHRSFTLGWDYRFRGSRETPGLMMAMDRGGHCRGVVHRLPDETLRAELDILIRREMSMVPTAFPPRWIKVRTEQGPVSALAFPMNRRSSRYIGALGPEETADILATACGFRGSMAEYLRATVEQLEALGIHDTYLWTLQSLVADRIEAMHGDRGVE